MSTKKSNTKQPCTIDSVKPRFHYAPNGEWGNPKTGCGRYWTTDVRHTALIDEVTCKYCLKLL